MSINQLVYTVSSFIITSGFIVFLFTVDVLTVFSKCIYNTLYVDGETRPITLKYNCMLLVMSGMLY